jgi:hypothetical protein
MERPVSIIKALALALLLACGCTPSFESKEVVLDLRVLAVQAEPPEAQVDLDAGTIEDVQVTLLAVDPVHPDQPATVQPRLCLPSDGSRCGKTAIDLRELAAPQGTIAFDLFSKVSDPRTLVPLVVAAQQDDKLKGLDGVRVQLELGVDTRDPAGVQYGTKQLLFSTRAPGDPERNHNPRVAGLELIDLSDPLHPVSRGTLAPGEKIPLPSQRDLGLVPHLPCAASAPAGNDCRYGIPDGIEEYDAIDLTGRLVHLSEYPSWDFFTTDGAGLDRSGADEPLRGVPAPAAGLLRINAGSGTGTLWLVVRDGRGGVGFARFPWEVQ